MSTSEVNSNGNGESSLLRAIGIVETVVWALFALAVAILVAVLVWATVDLAPAVGEVAIVPYLVLVGAAVLGTAVFAALAVLDP